MIVANRMTEDIEDTINKVITGDLFEIEWNLYK